jgi:hypothetical protein
MDYYIKKENGRKREEYGLQKKSNGLDASLLIYIFFGKMHKGNLYPLISLNSLSFFITLPTR